MAPTTRSGAARRPSLAKKAASPTTAAPAKKAAPKAKAKAPATASVKKTKKPAKKKATASEKKQGKKATVTEVPESPEPEHIRMTLSPDYFSDSSNEEQPVPPPRCLSGSNTIYRRGPIFPKAVVEQSRPYYFPTPYEIRRKIGPNGMRLADICNHFKPLIGGHDLLFLQMMENVTDINRRKRPYMIYAKEGQFEGKLGAGEEFYESPTTGLGEDAIRSPTPGLFGGLVNDQENQGGLFGPGARRYLPAYKPTDGNSNLRFGQPSNLNGVTFNPASNPAPFFSASGSHGPLFSTARTPDGYTADIDTPMAVPTTTVKPPPRIAPAKLRLMPNREKVAWLKKYHAWRNAVREAQTTRRQQAIRESCQELRDLIEEFTERVDFLEAVLMEVSKDDEGDVPPWLELGRGDKGQGKGKGKRKGKKRARFE